MAENHELRLQINANAAKSGSRVFVGAITSMKASLKGLDRDANGTFLRLIKNAKAANAAMKFKVGGINSQARTSLEKYATTQAKISTQAKALNRSLRTTSTAMSTVATSSTTLIASQTTLLSVMKRVAANAIRQGVAFAAISGNTGALAAAINRLVKAENRAAAAASKVAAGNVRVGTSAIGAGKGVQGLTHSVRGLENAFNVGYQASTLFRTGLGVITVGSFAKGIYDAGNNLDQFTVTMGIAAGSTKAAAKEMGFIDSLARDFGINLKTARDDFSKFAVASSLAGVSAGQTRTIFESVSKAMAVLGKGAEDQKLAFLALEQMMSKGIISSEELRRQLGERLPGAVNLMAKAVGVSTSELQKLLKAGKLVSSEVLPKFAKEVDKAFGPGLETASKRAGFAIGQMQAELQKLMEVAARNGFMKELAQQMRDLTTTLRSADLQDAAAALGQGLASAVKIGATGVNFLAENIELLASVARAVAGVLAVSFGQRIVTGIGAAIIPTKLFSNSLRGVAVSATSTSVATKSAAASITSAGVAATASTRSVTLFGAAFNTLRVGVGALLGPVGLAITALSFLPGIMTQNTNSVESFSGAYTDAMSRLGVSTMSFMNTVGDVEVATPFEKITDNIAALAESGNALSKIKVSSSFKDDAKSLINSLEGLSNTDVGKASIENVRALATEFSMAKGNAAELHQQALNLRTAMIAARTDNPQASAELGALDKHLSKLFQVVTLTRELQSENDKLSTVSTRGLEEATSQAETYRREIDAISFGAPSDSLATFSARTQEILALNAGGITGQMEALANKVGELGDEGSDAAMELFGLAESFTGTSADSKQLSTILVGLRKTINDNGKATEFQKNMIQLLITELNNSTSALGANQSGANQASTAINDFSATIQQSADTLANASNMAYQFAAAIQTAASAAKSTASVVATQMSKVKEDLRIAQLPKGEQAAAKKLNSSGIKAANDAAINAAREAKKQATGGADRLAAEIMLEKALQNKITTEKEYLGVYEQVTALNKSNTGGGKKTKLSRLSKLTDEKKLLENLQVDMTKRLLSLEKETRVLELLSSGQAKTRETAEFMSQAMQIGSGALDAQTLSMIQEIEAATKLNEALTKLARNPLKEWMDEIPSIEQALKDVQVTIGQGASDLLSNFFQTGELDFGTFLGNIAAKLADFLAQNLTKSIFDGLGVDGSGGLFGDMFGGTEKTESAVGGEAAGQSILAAFIQGGQNVAASIRAAMTSGGAQAGSQVSAGHRIGGANAASQQRAAGSANGRTISRATTTSGKQHGTSVREAINSGAQTHANAIRGASGGGGSTGGGGGILGTLLGAVFGSFAQGGLTSSPAPATTVMPATAFKHAPQYSAGTTNTSGIPAVLHPNEAVIPLSGGRKIPVDMGGAGVGGNTQANIMTFGDINISVESSKDDQTNEDLAAQIGKQMEESINNLVDQRIGEAQYYGGVLNPRGNL